MVTISIYIYIYIYTIKIDKVYNIGNKYHHHHHVMLVARISLTLSRYFSLSFIASGRSSELHPHIVAKCMFVLVVLLLHWPPHMVINIIYIYQYIYQMIFINMYHYYLLIYFLFNPQMFRGQIVTILNHLLWNKILFSKLTLIFFPSNLLHILGTSLGEGKLWIQTC